MIYDSAALQTECERGRQVGASTQSWLSVTGEPYVTIGHQTEDIAQEPGTVEEGRSFEWGFDAETAYFTALSAFHNYAHDRPGTLYWRSPPQYEQRADGRAIFYMRLLISEKHEPGEPSAMSAINSATNNLARAVNGMAKCHDVRKVASLDAADLITVGDLRVILEYLQGNTRPSTGELST